LLKTLNTGLAESALPDSHIEEAFEVWWPKLEGELKKLPKDEDLPRPQRTERDLLEEVLRLVRNQNRTLTNTRSRSRGIQIECLAQVRYHRKNT